MKLKDRKELFTKADKELTKMLSQAREDLFKLNMELKQRKLKKTSQVFWKRKEIAMILTALKEKQLIKKEEEK